ncbi:MAG TPA: hypothetical protein VF407_06320 [Polyangiaceae bacterium]
MMNPPEERRKKRSEDPLVALHYQLTVARTEGSIDTIVLADTAGMVVAGAGSWAACEEIAAYAPLLSQSGDDGSGSRIDELRSEIEVRPLRVSGQDVLLCSRRQRKSETHEAAITKAAQGIHRILAAA